jgi:hypothetical protein
MTLPKSRRKTESCTVHVPVDLWVEFQGTTNSWFRHEIIGDFLKSCWTIVDIYQFFVRVRRMNQFWYMIIIYQLRGPLVIFSKILGSHWFFLKCSKNIDIDYGDLWSFFSTFSAKIFIWFGFWKRLIRLSS